MTVSQRCLRIAPCDAPYSPWTHDESRHRKGALGARTAASLWLQADALDLQRGGDWRARASRRAAADRLRTEAARFDGIANRLQPVDDAQAA